MIAGRLRWREPGQKPGMGPKLDARGVRVRRRIALLHRGELEEARVAAAGARRGGARGPRSAAALEPLDATLDGSARRLRARTTRSSARSPIRASSAASATRTRTRSCTRRGSRRSSSRARCRTRSRRGSTTRRARRCSCGSIACARDLAGTFPEKVTAFRDEMAVHGRFRQPCPACGAPVQRIRYAENECNYCASCQTGGRLLADRSLSKLLGKDWPKSIDDLSSG